MDISKGIFYWDGVPFTATNYILELQFKKKHTAKVLGARCNTKLGNKI